jgi:antitoxin ParD1/3/4
MRYYDGMKRGDSDLRIGSLTARWTKGASLVRASLANGARRPTVAARRANMATMSISLSDPVKEWIEERVRSGHYANASEYIGDLVRSDRQRREGLVRALIEGEESGPSDRTVRDIIADTKLKIGNGQI